jgi:c-di-GMP-binding flagellar brake protein YcgR
MLPDTTLPQAAAARLEDFRIDSPGEIEAWLRQLLREQPRVQLVTPAGANLVTQLWSLDLERHSLSFEVQPGDPQLQHLLDCAEVMAVAYLDSIRLEFELDALVLVQGQELLTLRGAWPARMFRFQRRGAFRVQPLGSGLPRVLLRRPETGEPPLSLRVLDLSIGGLALQFPAELAPPPAGSELKAARVELERDQHFDADLRLQHAGEGPDGLLRLGCAFARLPAGAERTLQFYIDQTQKRQRLLRRG